MTDRAPTFASLLVAATVVTLSMPSRGAEIPFSGTLSIEVAALPAVQVGGSGVATLASPVGTALLTRAALPAGVFSQTGFSISVTTASAFPIAGLQITAANGAGTFARSGGALGGVMPIQGVAKVCLYSACSQAPLANVSVPVDVVGAGGVATAAGLVNVTVVGAPWTTGTAVVGGASRSGSAVGPAGRASSTALPGGRLSLVTPIFISTNIGGLSSLSAFGAVEVALQQPSPLCEVSVSQASYAEGEALVVTRARFANPRTLAAAASLRLELAFPVPGLAVPALDASVTLPAGFDTDFGPVTAFTFGPEHPRGRYELRCRIGDPASGEPFASDTASFTLPFTGTAPLCDVEVSQPVYVDGESFVATRVRFANPQGEDAYLRMRYELGLPDGTVDTVIDSDVVLPAGYDEDFGPATAWVVSPAIPRGDYELRCGLSDAYGAAVASDAAAFSVE